MEITGLENKVAVVTGAGRMRSIGRPIAVEPVSYTHLTLPTGGPG